MFLKYIEVHFISVGEKVNTVPIADYLFYILFYSYSSF